MKKVAQLISLFVFLIVKAQVGIGTDAPNDKAILHIVSPNSDQGVLIPSMTTDQRDANIAPENIADDGLLIYNTTEKCYNYYKSSQSIWTSLCGDSYASYTLSCGNVVAYGNYSEGTSLKSSNYITVPINVTTAGNYTIIAKTNNGYYFEKTGVFPTTGTFSVTLSGTGTPIKEGTDILTFSLNGITDSSCTSSTIAVAAPQISYTINCNGIKVNGTYETGVMLDSETNTITVPLKLVETAGNVSISTSSNNGVKFYSNETITNSSKFITLVGIGTPSMAGTYEYTFKTNGANPEFCFFEVTFITTLGSLSNPANRCKEIYDLGETHDGEYWIVDASGSSTPIKTFCDMTNGGYTLVWSYSESTAYNLYSISNSMEMNGVYRLNQNLPFNTVTTESGTMNYYNFRLPLATMTNINDQSNSKATLRARITENPTDMNDSWAQQNYADFMPPTSTLSPLNTSAPAYYASYPIQGKLFNQDLIITTNSKTYAGATLTGGYFYCGGSAAYPNHIDIANSATSNNNPFLSPDGVNTLLPSNVDNTFGYFGQTQVNHHFGKCGGPSGDETSFSTATCASSSLYPHTSFNGGEGRILQWFIK